MDFNGSDWTYVSTWNHRFRLRLDMGWCERAGSSAYFACLRRSFGLSRARHYFVPCAVLPLGESCSGGFARGIEILGLRLALICAGKGQCDHRLPNLRCALGLTAGHGLPHPSAWGTLSQQPHFNLLLGQVAAAKHCSDAPIFTEARVLH
jgi:hypothetical protein